MTHHDNRTTDTDLLVVGGGPAGATAALYAARIGRQVTLLSDASTPSLIAAAQIVDNYPGIATLGGFEFVATLEQQCRAAGVTLVNGRAVAARIENRRKFVETDDGRQLVGRALIIATGCAPRIPEIAGLDRYWGRGVSLCAWCDGAFFKDKRVAVCGGGNTAYASAAILARIAAHVTMLLPRRTGGAFAALRDQVRGHDRVTTLESAVVTACGGDPHLQTIDVLVDGSPQRLETAALFIATGQTPRTAWCSAVVHRDRDGFIIADAHGATDTAGVFAAGDLVAGAFRQLVIASAAGASASLAAERYLGAQW